MYWKLRYGFLESIHAATLERELVKRRHTVRRQVGVPVFYDGARIGWQRLDMIVDDRLILEIKSTEQLAPGAKRQLLSYLTSTRLQVGLLLHFGPRPKFYRHVSTKRPDGEGSA